MTSAVVVLLGSAAASANEDDWSGGGWATFVSSSCSEPKFSSSEAVSLEQLACCHNGSRFVGVAPSDRGGISTHDMNCLFLCPPVSGWFRGLISRNTDYIKFSSDKELPVMMSASEG